MNHADLVARVKQITTSVGTVSSGPAKKFTFTLEYGRGTTYSSGKPTLYGHSKYGRGSVLSGRPLRMFVDQFDDEAEARAAAAALRKGLKVKIEDMLDGGTTHVPLDVLTAGLPDSDY